MQVESVAWASAAFKTGFYAAFFLASLIAYTFYLKSNNIRHLATCMIFFILSFLCKEQAAALVFSLVCIDFLFARNLLSKKVIVEKIPFLILSIAVRLSAIYFLVCLFNFILIQTLYLVEIQVR